MIIRDPSLSANSSRDSRSKELVELIVLIPTIIETLAGTIPDHILEGKSLKSSLNCKSNEPLQEYATSEYDYSVAPISSQVNADPRRARFYMIATQRWKYIYNLEYRPILFNLQEYPMELNDLGGDANYFKIKRELNDQLLGWSLRHSQRITRSNAELVSRQGCSKSLGVRKGFW